MSGLVAICVTHRSLGCAVARGPDATGRVLDDGQHVGVGAVEEVDGEEVRRQNRAGLTAKLSNCTHVGGNAATATGCRHG